MEIELVTTADDALVADLVRLVNSAYEVGESDLWVAGTVRTDADDIADRIRVGDMLVARDGGRLIGCGCVRPLDEGTASLGLISVAPEAHGTGVGRAVVAAAEELARSRGETRLQLELLVPRDGVHPFKERLRAWYGRLGYDVVRVAPLDEVAPRVAPVLSTPCEFLIFQKAL